MHLKDNVKNFIYDQDYYISFYNNKIYIFNYQKIKYINSDSISLEFNSFDLLIKGNNFRVNKMFENEILIDGITKEMKIINEK